MSERGEATRGKHEPWQPGQSGNPHGRPKGSRNKLGEEFIRALHDDFVEHGVTAIETVRTEKPDAYLKVIASILPKEFKIEHVGDDLTDEQLASRLRQLAQALVDEGVHLVGGGTEAEAEPKPSRGVSTLQ